MLVGMGAVVDAQGHVSYPSWCDWLPGAGFFTSCQPETAAQMAADNSLNPAVFPNYAALNAAATTNAFNSMAQVDPAGAAAYNTAIACPTIAASLGAGALGQAACVVAGGIPCANTLFPDMSGLCDWYVYAAGGLLLIVVAGVGVSKIL